MTLPRFNFPCMCDAYAFPHRIGGGSCTGQAWAEFYFNSLRQECSGCNCTDGHTCDVAQGTEKIFECQAAQCMDSQGHILIPCELNRLYANV